MLRLLRRRQRDERGAVLAMIGIMSMTLVVFAAYAVDLGMQRVGRRDMQALADVVALDLARQLDGRTAGAIAADPAFELAKDQSVARNDTTLGSDPVIEVELGSVSQATGEFTEASPGALPGPTAVRVVASSDVDFAFVGGSGGVSRTAIAATALSNPPGVTQLNAFGCATVGSYLLNLSSSNSPLLNAILGSALNTTAVGYEGLANVDVGLDLLTAALGVGSPTELASTNVTVGELLTAVAEAMTQEGDSNAQVSAVNAINAALSASTRGTQISMGDIIAIGSGIESAVDTKVNVLSLVSGSAFLINGSNFISIPSLTVSLPGVVGANVSLQVIEGPQITCGNLNGVTRAAETSQVRLRVTGALGGAFGSGGLLSGLLGGTVLNASSTFTLELDLARVEAELTDIVCDGSTPQSVEVTITNQTAAQARLALDLDVQLLGLLNLTYVEAVIGASSPAPANGTYTLPLPQSYTTATRINGSTNPLPSLTGSNLTVSGLGVLTLNRSTLLSSVLNPLVAQLNPLITTLTNQLGVTFAGADLKAVADVSCSTPVLVTP